MSKVRVSISMSLDGFVAGPNQTLKEPLGVGGERLHEWVVPLRSFKALNGKTGGVVNESDRVVEEVFTNLGATIMGRNMFGGGRGPWDRTKPWKGWWGDNPPYHHPVFVLTHHAREPLPMEGGTTFNFVTDGIESALAQARQAAGGKDINVAGGAKTVQQYVEAKALDELQISLVPILLGAGERLFEGISELPGLELARTVAAPGVIHLKFARRKER
jgi:dihydrofolate reductase